MKTEQADTGRDIALRRLRLVSPWRTAQRAVPSTWLNLVCLDAPLVAVIWLWLFARTFHVPLQIGNAVALFLTAWLIYLADRFADASNLKAESPRSLRQEFCLRHREFWVATLALVAGFDAYVIWRTTAFQTFLVGAIVGVLAVVYLVANHPLGLIWRSLPAKELAIGILFAAGTVVALLPTIPSAPGFVFAAIGFAGLCALNCISIAGWERELDRGQRKVSIATRHPRVIRLVGPACLALALAAIGLAIVFRQAAPFFLCISVSALLLTGLNASPSFKEGRFFNRPRRLANRRSLGVDERTALADLVLLTPIVALLVTRL
jgi:hypothetical protein